MVLLAAAAGAAGGYLIPRKSSDPAGNLGDREENVSERAGPDGRFDRLVRALPLGVIVLNSRGHITFTNRAAEEIFGFNSTRMYGRTIIEAVPSVELERRVVEARYGEESMAPLVLPGRHGKRTYAVSAYQLPDDGGAVVLASDQTEIIALERARSEFISNVSHELRTPLSSIKLMLETVLAANDRESRELFLPKIGSEVDRMVQLVNDLLVHARAGAGQLHLRQERFDLTQVARSVVATFEQRADALHVSLTIEANEEVLVKADRDRLSQVLVNLIDNAVRHTPARGNICVRVDREPDYAILVVRDTGIGIPYNDLPHVFERFYVVDRSRARETGGSGLGLAIAKQIIEAHGGSIQVESLLGSGATFTCRIPVEQRSA
ncbi:MAG: cell wall metabolism sensor histidine kinase WalK [Candidatus Eremiobacteraeota bacterium]|nr:cell wall metabolism sensor histidine kinase WalK [Candidatus Eremiobacteraeota bacterium]